MSRVLVLAGATLAPATVTRGQDPKPAAAPVFSTDLEVVNVVVSVRDHTGRPVSDLSRNAFTILEDGRRQQLQLFARAVEPGQEDSLALTLGLLLDTSESMLKELKLSQQAAVRFLEAIPRARDLLTIFFDQDIRISRYDSENQQGLFARIVEAKGGGNTALYDSIAVYLSRVDDASGRKVLVLFTDGEDSISEISLPEILTMIRGSAVTIYAIAFTGGFPTGSTRALRSRAFLQQIAEMSGGGVFTPVSSRDLPGIYQKILDELAAQYVLGYVSDNPSRNGRFRKLKVQVNGQKLSVRHRAGYTAPSDDSRR